MGQSANIAFFSSFITFKLDFWLKLPTLHYSNTLQLPLSSLSREVF